MAANFTMLATFLEHALWSECILLFIIMSILEIPLNSKIPKVSANNIPVITSN